ncbi:MAG: glycosyltransferase family 39 protein [Phycisphaerales bacterium]|nr:glycosyltransferase family 39 protein [Phycisphaerales bacterium]
MSARRQRAGGRCGRNERLILWAVLVLWVACLAPLLTWGLPTRKLDPLLFGGDDAWRAENYQIDAALEERRHRRAGADVDLNPLAARDELVELTASEAQRAEILRRYRLYSRQPDEMITFQALQRMNPRAGDLDPRLYQYGGAYIYGVGAALGAAKVLGAIELTADATFYLEHPDAFGRFYVVARSLSLLMGAVALAGVYELGRRTAGRAGGWAGLVAAATMPVLISGVLEAKPHVPSAAMLVWATVFALDYHARGRGRDALKLGLASGLAAGLVLTGVAAALYGLALLIAAPAARRGQTARHVILAGAVAALVYAATNPFLVYNVLFARDALASNVNNSLAMYAEQVRRAGEGAVRVAQLAAEGAGPLVLLGGLGGLVVLLRRWPRETLVAAAAGVGLTVLAAFLAAGKPAEFTRFLVLPCLLAASAAAGLVTAVPRRGAWRPVAVACGGLVLLLGSRCWVYLGAFATDRGLEHEPRHLAGCFLAEHRVPDESIGVMQEPAPYAVPPLDFARARVVLLPKAAPRVVERDALPTWLVLTADGADALSGAWWLMHYELVRRWPESDADASPITWASKPTFVFRRVVDGAGT